MVRTSEWPPVAGFRTFSIVPPPENRVVAVPGRVNLMGDHTDYNAGLALPMAIDRWTTVTARPNGDDVVRARSAQFDGLIEVPIDLPPDPGAVEPPWGRFVAGAVSALLAREVPFSGVDLSVESTVPPGAGLSSSTALSVGLIGALAPELDLELLEHARLALDIEARATGVPGGLMDQLVALSGREKHALLVDFATFATETVPLPPMMAVLVVHSGLMRTLAGSEYAARRAECERIAADLGLASVSRAKAAQVARLPLARHVVSENARVVGAAAALRSGDVGEVGRLMLASHASLRDDYAVSTPELDALVDALVDAGAAGARLTGAGFGGCVVAVCSSADADRVLAEATTAYQESIGAVTGFDPTSFVARAVDGARVASRRER